MIGATLETKNPYKVKKNYFRRKTMRRYARTASHGKPHGPPENVSLLLESFYYLLDIFSCLLRYFLLQTL